MLDFQKEYHFLADGVMVNHMICLIRDTRRENSPSRYMCVCIHVCPGDYVQVYEMIVFDSSRLLGVLEI